MFEIAKLEYSKLVSHLKLINYTTKEQLYHIIETPRRVLTVYITSEIFTDLDYKSSSIMFEKFKRR